MQSNTFRCSADSDDTALVGDCLGGDRDAFAQIVARYQALIASIAYNATGNISQSEDRAQETFLVAWRHLKSLEEPGKLRAWLCGIARRATANTLRRQRREPSQDAHPLEHAMDVPALSPIPADHAISREEESILWRSLEQIPESYREPLILKRAVAATDLHRWTQIRRSCERYRRHPTGEWLSLRKSVLICVHLWLPLFHQNPTAGFRFNAAILRERIIFGALLRGLRQGKCSG